MSNHFCLSTIPVSSRRKIKIVCCKTKKVAHSEQEVIVISIQKEAFYRISHTKITLALSSNYSWPRRAQQYDIVSEWCWKGPTVDHQYQNVFDKEKYKKKCEKTATGKGWKRKTWLGLSLIYQQGRLHSEPPESSQNKVSYKFDTAHRMVCCQIKNKHST